MVFSLFTCCMRLFGMFDFFLYLCASSVIFHLFSRPFLTGLGLLFDFSNRFASYYLRFPFFATVYVTTSTLTNTRPSVLQNSFQQLPELQTTKKLHFTTSKLRRCARGCPFKMAISKLISWPYLQERNLLLSWNRFLRSTSPLSAKTARRPGSVDRPRMQGLHLVLVQLLVWFVPTVALPATVSHNVGGSRGI